MFCVLHLVFSIKNKHEQGRNSWLHILFFVLKQKFKM